MQGPVRNTIGSSDRAGEEDRFSDGSFSGRVGASHGSLLQLVLDPGGYADKT